MTPTNQVRAQPPAVTGNTFTPAGNRRLALLSLAIGLLLTASWFVPGLDTAWAALDRHIFYALNGTVAWGTPFAEFWALTGDRRFDVVTALVIFVIFVEYFLRGDLDTVRRGIAFGFYTAFVLTLVLVIQREFFAFPRMSPSSELAPFHSIHAQVPWSTAKEHSNRSLPGDHATVMFIITLLWWRAGGARIGSVAVALTILFSLPRVAAGAHWGSDILLGAGVATLVTVAILDGTPVGRWLGRLGDLAARAVVGSWLYFARTFAREGEPVEGPKRQILRGLCIGTADLIPGVSGGTVALILGIYHRLLAMIARVDGVFVRQLLRGQAITALRRVDFLFAAPLLIGILGALVLFSRVIPIGILLREFPEIVYGLFFGLIAASIVSLLRWIRVKRVLPYVWLAGGVLVGATIVTTVPMNTPDTLGHLFLYGMAAVTAMLVPGVSGAFVLLILGKYVDTIEAIGRLDLSFLVPLAAGVVTGALVFSRFITWMLARYWVPTMLTVTGVLIGSLLAVWPFQDRIYAEIGGKERLVDSVHYLPQGLDAGTISGVMAIVAGILLFRLLEKLAYRATRDSPSAAGVASGRDTAA